MKLAYNPNFKPFTININDEVRGHGIFHFNITAILKFINNNPE